MWLEREKERHTDRQTDSCIIFKGKIQYAIELLAPDVDVSK